MRTYGSNDMIIHYADKARPKFSGYPDGQILRAIFKGALESR